MKISSVKVSGVRFDKVTMRETVEIISNFAHRRDKPRYVCTGNLDHLRLAEKDREFAEAYEKADLVVADGMPVVWLSKMAGNSLPERVTGSTLVWELARASHEQGFGIFLLGGMEGTASKSAEIFREKFPNVNIVGTYCPPHASFGSEAEQQKITEKIRTSRPDVLLVAFGAPKQEKWIKSNLENLEVPVSIGVGGSFEMVSGNKRRAPGFIQNAGLEWVWRFSQDPKRLYKRYLQEGVPFFLKTFYSEISR